MVGILLFADLEIFRDDMICDFEEIVEYINTEKPDIINLQEVAFGDLIRFDRKENLFLELQERTGLKGIYSPKVAIKNTDASWGR